MCFNPVTIKCADGVHEMKVPCGHCLACVKAYQQMWVARLEEEKKSWIPVDGRFPIVFFTLTYSQENIPKNYLFLSSTGVHLTKKPISVFPVTYWNTTLKEPVEQAKERQHNIEEDFKSYLQAYLDTFDETLEQDEFDLTSDDFPQWCFEPESMPVGSLIKGPIAFNSVRYSDVRNWLKSCRVYYSRFCKSVRVPSLKKDWKTIPANPRYITEIDGTRLPDSAIPAAFKYFICSEYGPRTLRPHYHGVMFGVTIDEFDKYFKPLWENRFGHVESSAFDVTKGGMLYVSKYCSKGSYDNPLCKKDFFYPNGREYHSDKYEGSLLRFGVNLPLSDPCFRLMSNGLGIGYVFRKNVQSKWNVNIDHDFVVRSKDLICPPPSIPIDENPNSPVYSKYSKTYKTIHYENQNDIFDIEDIRFVCDSFRSEVGYTSVEELVLRTYNNKGRMLSESVFDFRLGSNLELEDRLISTKYARNIVYHPKDAQKGVLVSKVAESALPRYYHRWLIPPSAKLYLSSAAIRRDTLDAQAKWRQVQLAGASDEKILQIGELERIAELEQSRTLQTLRKSADKFYSRYDYQDLVDSNLL